MDDAYTKEEMDLHIYSNVPLPKKPSRYYYEVKHVRPWGILWNLIKKPKPCYIGDKIHIKSKGGMFTVSDVSMRSITLTTKHRKFKTSWNDFKCLAGGHWNMKRQ